MNMFWSIFFVVVFVLLILLLNFYSKPDFESKTFFECGFEAIQSQRSLFSLRFFNLTILFLIFDMEIMFILPLVFFYSQMKMIFFFIYLILFMGLFLEWNQGSLMWK